MGLQATQLGERVSRNELVGVPADFLERSQEAGPFVGLDSISFTSLDTPAALTASVSEAAKVEYEVPANQVAAQKQLLAALN